MSTNPYLSVVVTSRNDNHGGDLIQRMKLFADVLERQCQINKLLCELVVVEWNPPEGSPLLKDVLNWPDNEYCLTRIITVSREAHNQLRNSNKLAMFQMIAKNVGIKRAVGEFILCTNIDVLLSDGIIKFISRGMLRGNRMYRADRYDINNALLAQTLSLDEVYEYCSNNILRKNTRYISVNPLEWIDEALYGRRLHTNACGDFTLLSNVGWNLLRGYPEFPIYSIYLDGIFCYQAHYSGIKEVVINSPVYHIEHQQTWANESEPMSRNISDRGIPSMPYSDYIKFVEAIRKNKRSVIERLLVRYKKGEL